MTKLTKTPKSKRKQGSKKRAQTPAKKQAPQAADHSTSGRCAPLVDQLTFGPEAYAWGCESDCQSFSAAMNWLKFARRKTYSESASPLRPVSAGTMDVPTALSNLLQAFVLGRFGDKLDAADWERQFDALAELSKGEDRSLLQDNPVVHQLLFAELPLTLGLFFPDEAGSDALVQAGKSCLAIAFEELLDGDGMPHAAYVDTVHQLLACWTRCRKLADAANTECLDVDTQTQFEYFVRQTVRLTRKDESLVFSDADSGRSVFLMLEAMSTYHDEDDLKVARVAFPKSVKSKKKKSARKAPSLLSLPEASTNSEWGEIAVMQAEWLPKSPRLTVTYRDSRIRAELSTGAPLFSGEMRHEFMLDGSPIAPNSEWEVVCWNSDQDGDFLELECELEGGLKWQKHFLLARNELFLLSADAILGIEEGQLDYRMSWPLADNIGFGRPQETTEIFLTRKSRSVASILPVAMPEWQSGRTNFSLAIDDSQLSFEVNSSADEVPLKNLYCPLFFDLDPKRCRKPLTWRQLTVAEQLAILPRDQAVGYRVQVGNQQWLIYRSLIECRNRTVFGQNLSAEFYVGTFESDGTCSEIISVD